MKKIISLCFVAVAMLLSNVEAKAESPIRLGVKGGLNISKLDGGFDSKTKPAYQVGATVDVRLIENFWILSGIEYTVKESKWKGEDGEDHTKVSPGYLQVPIYLGYKLPVTNNLKVVLAAGPYLAFGVNGKIEDNEDVSHEDFFKKDRFKRFDTGVGISAGVELLNHLAIMVGYDHGLVDISKDEIKWKDKDIKTRNAYLTVGYKF